MKKNPNIIMVESEAKLNKEVSLSEGDALVKTKFGWVLVEAEDEDSEEDKKEDENEMKEEEGDEDKKDDEKKDDEKKEESKK